MGFISRLYDYETRDVNRMDLSPRTRAEFRADAKERDRVRRAEQKEIRRIRENTERDAQRAAEKLQNEANAAAKAVHAAAADEERLLLTQPRTQWTGGTAKNASPIFVWHHQCEMPDDVAQHVRSIPAVRDFGPVVALRPGGGITNDDTLVHVLEQTHPESFVSDAGALWRTVALKATEDILRDYPILKLVRDDRRFAQLLRGAGVCRESTDTEYVPGTYSTYPRKVTTVQVPSLVYVAVARDGLRLSFAHRNGVTARDWNVDKIKSLFNAHGVKSDKLVISDGSSGTIDLRFRDRDPLSDPLPNRIHDYDARGGRSYLGRAADGSDVWITWVNNGGVLVSGMVGSGKSQGLIPVIAGMASHAELHIFDGKGSATWRPFEHVAWTYDATGDRTALDRLLDDLKVVARKRAHLLYDETGDDSFWDTDYDTRMRLGLVPILVVIEEAPVFIGTETEDAKAAKALANKVSEGMRLWRSAGIVIIPVAQRVTNDQLPAVVRGQADQRVCFRVKAKEDVVAMFQSVPEDDSLNAMRIPSGLPGRFVAEVDRRGLVLGQAVYAPRDVLSEYLMDKQPAPDQLTMFSGTKKEKTNMTTQADDTAAHVDDERLPDPPAYTMPEQRVFVMGPGPSTAKPKTKARTSSSDGDDW